VDGCGSTIMHVIIEVDFPAVVMLELLAVAGTSVVVDLRGD